MPVTWDFFKNRVQKGMPHGQYVSGRATVIGAGPPNLVAFADGEGGLDQVQSELVYLIGLVNNLTIASANQVQRLFEIGSVRQYFITSHAITNIALSRVLYHGPNILRALYAYYSSSGSTVAIKSLLKRFNTMPIGTNAHTVQIAPGQENMFINMTSDLFSQPVGLLFMMRDQDNLTYTIQYAENCYVSSHNLSTDSNSVIVSENVTIECERILPIPSASADLVRTISEDVLSTAEEGDLPQPTATA